jgi:hypothetical protein
MGEVRVRIRGRGPLALSGKRSARASLPSANESSTRIYVTCTDCPAAHNIGYDGERELARAGLRQGGRRQYIYTRAGRNMETQLRLASRLSGPKVKHHVLLYTFHAAT